MEGESGYTEITVVVVVQSGSNARKKMEEITKKTIVKALAAGTKRWNYWAGGMLAAAKFLSTVVRQLM